MPAAFMRCPSCRSTTIHRSRRRGLERVISLFQLFPFRCWDCGHRFVTRLGRIARDVPTLD